MNVTRVMKLACAVLIAGLLSVVITGCIGDPVAETEKSVPARREGGSEPLHGVWVLKDAGGPDRVSGAWVGLADDGSLEGRDRCDSIKGRWQVDDSKISFTLPSKAKGECGSFGLAQRLMEARSWTVTLDKLTLANDAGQEIATLRMPSGDAQQLIGRWNAPVPQEGDRSFVIFDPDRSMTGTDDCNSIFGRWRVSDEAFRVEGFGSTTVGCFGDDPSISTVLTEARSWRIQSNGGEDVLMLLSDANRELMQLIRADER